MFDHGGTIYIYTKMVFYKRDLISRPSSIPLSLSLSLSPSLPSPSLFLPLALSFRLSLIPPPRPVSCLRMSTHGLSTNSVHPVLYSGGSRQKQTTKRRVHCHIYWLLNHGTRCTNIELLTWCTHPAGLAASCSVWFVWQLLSTSLRYHFPQAFFSETILFSLFSDLF